MRTVKIGNLLASYLLSACVGAFAVEGWCAETEAAANKVSDVRQLLVAAIDSSTGTARGEFVGPFAEGVKKKFRSDAPILVTVSTEKRLSQEGCSRLKMVWSQDNVMLPDAKGPQRKSVEVGLNYCRDGMPPRKEATTP
jgi:hypothetical protein